MKEPQRCGITELESDGKTVLMAVEKAKEPKSNLAVIGVYGFNSASFRVHSKLKPPWRSEMEIADAISLLISEGFNVWLHRVRDGAPVVGRARIGEGVQDTERERALARGREACGRGEYDD